MLDKGRHHRRDHVVAVDVIADQAVDAVVTDIAQRALVPGTGREHSLRDHQPGLIGKYRVGRNLLVHEVGKRCVPIERVDQIIAVRPGVGPDSILVVPVRLGEMHQVHPVASPALAVMRTREQAVDEPLISVRRLIVEEPGDFLTRRWEAEQIKRKPADQGPAVGFRCRLKMFLPKPGKNEGVNRIPGPMQLCRKRQMECVHP